MKRYLSIVVIFLAACAPLIPEKAIPLPIIITPSDNIPTETLKTVDPSTIDYGIYWSIHRDSTYGYAFAYPSKWFINLPIYNSDPNEIKICNYSYDLYQQLLLHNDWNSDEFYRIAFCLQIVEYLGNNDGALMPLDQAVQLFTFPLTSTEGSVQPEWVNVFYPENNNQDKVIIKYRSIFNDIMYLVAFRTKTNSIIYFTISKNDLLPNIEVIAIVNSVVLSINGFVELPKIIPSEIIIEEMLK
jgi:hypothetical protein